MPFSGVHIGDDDGLTLTFSLAAIKRLATPGKVSSGARMWNQYVGILSNNPRAAGQYAREHNLI